MEQFIMAIDQGTTGSRAILFSHRGAIIASSYREFTQHYPKPGWVEHDADEIWQTVETVIVDVCRQANVTYDAIAALGITNQRETCLLWDRKTGKPVHNAIVWQCRRTSGICDRLKQQGHSALFQRKTGLVVDAYFSGTKVQWLLDTVPGVRKRAEAGELAFGTIDTWLVWKLSGGRAHVTDHTNASRTLLYNIHDLRWDAEILSLLGIPAGILPTVRDSSGIFGYTAADGVFGREIPIGGIAGDQQAALFGQGCFERGQAKNTYGTGCFLVVNTGDTAVVSPHGLLTTIACDRFGKPCFALEGSVFIGGAVIQWLRDALKIVHTAHETEKIATSIDSTEGVYIVPAFVGLGAPWWDMEARGAIVGITRGAGKAHLVRASLESIAFQTGDLVSTIARDMDMPLTSLKVDGGACANNFLMQFQADILNIDVVRPTVIESTALGAAFLAGMATGFWADAGAFSSALKVDRVFKPVMSESRRAELLQGWRRAVRSVLTNPDQAR